MQRVEEAHVSPSATLVVSGDDVRPDEVSEILGLLPSRAFTRGAPYGHGHVRQHGMWAVSSEDNVRSEDLDEHLLWLAEKIEPAREALQNYLRTSGGFAFITCFWPSPEGHGGPRFSPTVLTKVGATDIPLQVDAYLTGAE